MFVVVAVAAVVASDSSKVTIEGSSEHSSAVRMQSRRRGSSD